MEVVKCFLFAILHIAFSLLVLVHSQDQSGFISIDCGIPEGSSYTDNITGIHYISDANFIGTGVNRNISSEINTTGMVRQYLNVRSFPNESKVCYTLKPAQGKNHKYLIRAGFLYGNYDQLGQVPRFDLYLGVNWWDSVILDDASRFYRTGIIHVPLSDYIDICLVDAGFGTLFISYLELRLLSINSFGNAHESLTNFGRSNYGSTTGDEIRYPYDEYDRFWSPDYSEEWTNLSTNSSVDTHDNINRVPSIVMETAAVPINSSAPIEFSWIRDDPTTQLYFYLYFAELQKLKANESREFDIYINGEFWHGPVSPAYLQTTTINNTVALNGSAEFLFTITKTENSTLPPLINGVEYYIVVEQLQSETDQEDADAIMNIKSYYKLKRSWHGDPCAPKFTTWDGLNCSYNGHHPPRIISLDLSSSGLTGEVSPYISNLTMIQYLDLSNNSLSGSVPNFLSQLPYLRVLNLSENMLSGSVPPELMERSKNGTLSLNVGKNKLVCSSGSCKSKKVVAVVTTIATAFILLLIAVTIFWIYKKRKQGEAIEHTATAKSKERHFPYSKVLNITNNLERILGKGKFGTVYHGHLDEAQVAVKIFSPSLAQGYKQFRDDAEILTKLHHRNLVAYAGYCDEGMDKALICEHMENGNLEGILSDSNSNFLSWQERLQIAMDAAQGLEYLHNGCRPPIIHGNLKTTNILLKENFQAKLADFGLSKVFIVEGSTKEYLDPEYYVTNKLTEKSDIYSFGVVLLEIITSRPAMASDQQNIHITQWIRSLLNRGNIKGIIDSRLEGDYFIDSVWKAVELAMACASTTSIKRPCMTQVVMELNQSLAMEISRVNKSEGTIQLVSVNLGTGVIPKAR